MTVGQQLIEQGRRQGIEQGHQEMLMLLFRQRCQEAITLQVEQRVAAAPRAQLDAWTSRVLSAAMLAELLRD